MGSLSQMPVDGSLKWSFQELKTWLANQLEQQEQKLVILLHDEDEERKAHHQPRQMQLHLQSWRQEHQGLQQQQHQCNDQNPLHHQQKLSMLNQPCHKRILLHQRDLRHHLQFKRQLPQQDEHSQQQEQMRQQNEHSQQHQQLRQQDEHSHQPYQLRQQDKHFKHKNDKLSMQDQQLHQQVELDGQQQLRLKSFIRSTSALRRNLASNSGCGN